MEYGYVKRGRGYGLVEVKDRTKLPKVEAVRWRFAATDDNGDIRYSEWFTTDAARVLATKPLTGSQILRLARQKELAEHFTRDWRSLGEWSIGLWNKLKANPLLELRRERLSAKVWQWQARRKT